MRVWSWVLVLGCGAAPIETEVPEDSRAWVAVQHPCDVLLPRARRSLAPMLRTIGAEPDSDRPPFTDCHRAGDAAWMFFPRSATVEWMRPEPNNLPDLPLDEAVPRIEVRYQVVYARGDTLIVAEPQLYTDDPLNVSTDLIDVQALSDIDGDGRVELAVTFSETVWEESPPMRRVIFTATDDGVVAYAPAEGIPVISFVDFDEDGRLDIVSDAVWSATQCGMDPPPDPLPPVLFHAQEDGTFSASSRVAAAYLRTHCPASPGALVPAESGSVEYGTLLNVACARAWGASVGEVQEQLRREYPELGEDDYVCAYDLAATLQWAEIDPPVRLDQQR